MGSDMLTSGWILTGRIDALVKSEEKISRPMDPYIHLMAATAWEAPSIKACQSPSSLIYASDFAKKTPVTAVAAAVTEQLMQHRWLYHEV